ncbi:unnamed protein product [Calypogeia fissa]
MHSHGRKAANFTLPQFTRPVRTALCKMGVRENRTEKKIPVGCYNNGAAHGPSALTEGGGPGGGFDCNEGEDLDEGNGNQLFDRSM